jgi:tetratricopeptide (TPR) repeat protein
LIVLPESLLTRRNLGLAYFRKGDMINASAQFTIALDQGKDVLAAKLLARIYLDSANVLRMKFAEANREGFDEVKNVSNIQEQMKSADVHFFLGDTMIAVSKPPKPKKGDTKETWRIERYHLTLSVDGGVVVKMKYDGDKPYTPKIDSTFYFQAVAEFDKAIEVLKKAQVISLEDPDVSESLMNAYIGAARNNEARVLLKERVIKYPDSKYDHYNLGVFLLKDSSYSEAIAEFRTAFIIDSTFLASIPDTSRSGDLGRTSKVDTIFSSSVVFNIAATYVNWGVMQQLALKAAGKEDDVSYKEKFKMALPYLEKAVVKKGDIQMWELLGQVYANLNMKEKALEAYDKADAIRKGKN